MKSSALSGQNSFIHQLRALRISGSRRSSYSFRISSASAAVAFFDIIPPENFQYVHWPFSRASRNLIFCSAAHAVQIQDNARYRGVIRNRLFTIYEGGSGSVLGTNQAYSLKAAKLAQKLRRRSSLKDTYD